MTTEETKNKIANQNGYKSWSRVLLDLTQSEIATILVENMESEAMILYANQENERVKYLLNMVWSRSDTTNFTLQEEKWVEDSLKPTQLIEN